LRNNKYLYLATVAFFALGIINIHFSLLGTICMVLPFALAYRDKKKTWCTGYCPRASLFTTLGKFKKKTTRKIPRFILNGDLKKIILVYFTISLFFVTMSTIRVAAGKMMPILYPRFMIVIPIPIQFPQLFSIEGLAPWLTHLSFRMYSMMMTTTTFGLILGALYRPRTWCTVCPVSTISDMIIVDGKKPNASLKKSA